MASAFKRRNISNRIDITHSFRQNRVNSSHFSHSWASFDAKNGVRSIRHIKCNGNSYQTSKYLQQDRYNAQFSSKSSKFVAFFAQLCLFRRLKTTCEAFDVKNTMEIAFKHRNISDNSEITHSSLQDRGIGRILRTFRHVSTPKNDVRSVRRVKYNGYSV